MCLGKEISPETSASTLMSLTLPNAPGGYNYFLKGLAKTSPFIFDHTVYYDLKSFQRKKKHKGKKRESK